MSKMMNNVLKKNNEQMLYIYKKQMTLTAKLANFNCVAMVMAAFKLSHSTYSFGGR